MLVNASTFKNPDFLLYTKQDTQKELASQNIHSGLDLRQQVTRGVHVKLSH